MADDRREPPAIAVDALIAQAKLGGPEAGLAARRAAVLAERSRPALAREALALAARIDPHDPSPRLDLARLHAEAGDLESAKNEAAQVVRDALDQAARARAAFLLGELARAAGENGAARSHFELVLAIEDRLLAADRSNPNAARWYARARGKLADLDERAGELQRAWAGAEGALAMLHAVAAQTGEAPILAADIADAEVRLATLELDKGEANSARRRLSEAIGRYEALAVTEKDEPHWRAMLADAWSLAGEADFARGAHEGARECMDKAVQARLQLAARHPTEAWALAGAWRVRAALLAALGDKAGATDSLAQACALAERLAAEATGDDSGARFLVHTLVEQADHAAATGALLDAHASADSARAIAERHARRSSEWCGETAACWERLADIAHLAGDKANAFDAFARSVEFRRMAQENDPGDLTARRWLAAALLRLGEAALDNEAHASARAAFEESVSLRSRHLEAAPDDPRAAHALAAALERLGLAAMALNDAATARAVWKEELALAEHIFHAADIAGTRFRAIVASHLARAGGVDASDYRAHALAHFDLLAEAGMLTERETALRRALWNSA